MTDIEILALGAHAAYTGKPIEGLTEAERLRSRELFYELSTMHDHRHDGSQGGPYGELTKAGALKRLCR